MIWWYGGDETIMLVGVHDFGNGVPSPFVATGPRQRIIEKLGEDMPSHLDAVKAFEELGVIMAFDNVGSAERFSQLINIAFETASKGVWGEDHNQPVH
jgi:hypothetical protein